MLHSAPKYAVLEPLAYELVSDIASSTVELQCLHLLSFFWWNRPPFESLSKPVADEPDTILPLHTAISERKFYSFYLA